MINKVFTAVNIVISLWGLALISISELYPEYTRYFLYFSILIIIPLIVLKLVRVRKEDKNNDTENFQFQFTTY